MNNINNSDIAIRANLRDRPRTSKQSNLTPEDTRLSDERKNN